MKTNYSVSYAYSKYWRDSKWSLLTDTACSLEKEITYKLLKRSLLLKISFVQTICEKITDQQFISMWLSLIV